jgi:hypothetical protein
VKAAFVVTTNCSNVLFIGCGKGSPKISEGLWYTHYHKYLSITPTITHSMNIPRKPTNFVQYIRATVLILATGTAGIYALAYSGAATFAVSGETEAGVTDDVATVVDGSGASGGKAVRFDTDTSTPPPTAGKCSTLANLDFCDDFDGAANAAPDSTKWRVLTGSSWGGQCFRNERENLATDGQGNLKMTLINKGTTQCTDGTGNPTNVTSGGMDTQGKHYIKYGKIEIRAKLSCAKSVWGAFWTATGTGPAWPQSGEIDIYEQFGNRKNEVKNTIHAGNPHWQAGATYSPSAVPLCQDYHVYAADWRPGYIQFSLDGTPTTKYTEATAAGRPWPFDTYDQRLLIDLQYGGPGYPSPGEFDLGELPSSMLVDYVHVFK